ncbi:AMP-binding protein [Pelomicrobium methylotrophicum]|nr:AMP-binding protein [Pelomicrobium methylotrophicum]
MRTVRHVIDAQAAERPEHLYLIAPETGRGITYARLREHSVALTRYLLGRGLNKGDKVSLMLHNGYQTARLFLGVMYGGFVVSPVNLLSQPTQLRHVLDHSDSKLVFVGADFEQRVRAMLKEIRRDIAVEVIDVDAEEIFDPAAVPQVLLPEVDEEDDALLMYTSGTTGLPKGVVLTHKNVVSGGFFVTQAHQLTPQDRVLASLPLYHINGQIVTAVAPLVHGGSVVMPHRFSVSNFWDLACRYGCTWINVVPTIISYLLNSPDPRGKGLDLSKIRFCRSASAPLPPVQHKAFEEKFGIGIIETFGMTETAAPCFTNPLDPARRKIGSPGQAFGNEAKIVDPDTGRPLPPGQVGEMMVRGDNVMRGYYKDPAATAKTLEPDGWMHTGDLGYMDEDGFVFVTGRIKELIIKGGENIAPREIDEALLKHPAVLEAAAVGIPDEHYGQEIAAYVVLKEGCEGCTQEELTEFCREQLGRYKTPKLIRFVPELPKGPSGKVQRLKLLELQSPPSAPGATRGRAQAA